MTNSTSNTITGHTRLVGLVGWPVKHTLSPFIHNAAFKALGLDWCYVPLPVHPERVAAAIQGIRALSFAGINVTVPHKQAVIPLLDRVAPHAQTLGAVNTIVVRTTPDGTKLLEGHNTDDAGFIRALKEAGFDLAKSNVLVLGAGGAARAVIHSLLRSGVTTVTVLNRTLERAQALVAQVSIAYPSRELLADRLKPDSLIQQASEANLLVNATSLGMSPRINHSPWPDTVPFPDNLTVFDLVYRPRQTQLLRQAAAAGAKTIDGLGMLIYQAALAFEIWTGQWPSIDVMRRAALQHIDFS